MIEEAWKVFSRDALPEGVPDSTLAAVQLNLARCVCLRGGWGVNREKGVYVCLLLGV